MDFFKTEYGHFLVSSLKTAPKNKALRLHFQEQKTVVKNPSAWLKTSVCDILFFRQKRRYVYKDGSFADDFSRTSRRILKFFYKQVTTGVEEGNLFLLSSVGEMLESQGLLRLHACAFEDGNSVYIFPGDSGFGKSTLAKEILLQTEMKILSDEMVLTDGSHFYSFPLRISLKDPYESDTYPVEKWSRNRHSPKWQILVPRARISITGRPGKIFLSNEMNTIKFFVRVMTGYGLAQMKEYFIRSDNFVRLIRLVFQRFYFFLKLYPHIETMDVGQRQSQKMLNLLVKTTE